MKPTHGVFTICMEMFGNGPRTGIRLRILWVILWLIRKDLPLVPGGQYEVEHGITMKITRVLHGVIRIHLILVTMMGVFELVYKCQSRFFCLYLSHRIELRSQKLSPQTLMQVLPPQQRFGHANGSITEKLPLTLSP